MRHQSKQRCRMVEILFAGFTKPIQIIFEWSIFQKLYAMFIDGRRFANEAILFKDNEFTAGVRRDVRMCRWRRVRRASKHDSHCQKLVNLYTFTWIFRWVGLYYSQTKYEYMQAKLTGLSHWIEVIIFQTARCSWFFWEKLNIILN